MEEIFVTHHAIEQYRTQAQQPPKKNKIPELIKQMWHEATPQEIDIFVALHKMSKYGDQKKQQTEHRRFKEWILTKVDNTIVTVHRKTAKREAAEQHHKRAIFEKTKTWHKYNQKRQKHPKDKNDYKEKRIKGCQKMSDASLEAVKEFYEDSCDS